MNSPQSDEELGRAFRRVAASLGWSPNALLKSAEPSAYRHRWSVMPNSAPFHHVLNETIIKSEHLERWQEWSDKLIPPGCRIDRLIWPDTTSTTRLLSPKGLVLAAFIEHPRLPNQ